MEESDEAVAALREERGRRVRVWSRGGFIEEREWRSSGGARCRKLCCQFKIVMSNTFICSIFT